MKTRRTTPVARAAKRAAPVTRVSVPAASRLVAKSTRPRPTGSRAPTRKSVGPQRPTAPVVKTTRVKAAPSKAPRAAPRGR